MRRVFHAPGASTFDDFFGEVVFEEAISRRCRAVRVVSTQNVQLRDTHTFSIRRCQAGLSHLLTLRHSLLFSYFRRLL